MSEMDGNDGQQPKGVFSSLMADGEWLYLKGEYKKAIGSYTAALSVKPGDRGCLVGRARCQLKLGLSEGALQDAEASLKEDRSYFEGLYQKAEALYYMGEFEFALVFYHRGQKLRPQVQEFRLGIQKAQEAIENCVGSPSSAKLEIKGDLSFLQRDEERVQPLAAVQHLRTGRKQQSPKTPKSERTTRQLLGEFYSDKKYLEKLLQDQDLIKGRTRSGERLQDVIQSCLTYLDTCTEFWSQEKPVGAQKRRSSANRRRSAPAEPAQFLLASLDDIDAELTSGNAEAGLKKAEGVLKEVQGWSEREVPNKRELLGSLHSCIGNALMELGEADRALEHHHRDLKLAEECKLPDGVSRALDNIGRIHAQTGRFAQAIEFWERKVPEVRGGLERTWLFHELGWCYLELERHEEARAYAVRCAAAAADIADEKWQMNAHVLVAQSQLKLGNVESCVSHFEEALSRARLQEDASAVPVILKALDDARRHLPQ